MKFEEFVQLNEMIPDQCKKLDIIGVPLKTVQ